MPLQGKTRQVDRLKRYLEEFESVTQLMDMRDLGIMRLSERIRELEADGWRISHDREAVQNRWGQPCHVTRYTLIRKQQTELGL